MEIENILPENHPYFDACAIGDKDRLAKFWADNVSIYSSSETKRDVLGQAFEARNYDLIRFALENGYFVDHPTGVAGATALMAAITIKDIGLIDLFLASGANINFVDRHGYTPYLLAVAGGSLVILDRIVRENPEKNIRTLQGLNDFILASDNDNIELMERLCLHGADINVRDSAGCSPLIQASKRGSFKTCQWLIDHGADIQARDRRNKTALDWAKANGHVKVVDLLESR
jgi:ankyrin repeat protein